MTYSVVGEYLSLPQVLLWLNLPHHALCVSTTYRKTKMRKQFTVSHSNTSFFAFSFQNFIYILTSFDNHFFLGQKKVAVARVNNFLVIRITGNKTNFFLAL